MAPSLAILTRLLAINLPQIAHNIYSTSLNTHDLTLTTFSPDRTRTTDTLGLSGTPLLRWGLGAVVIMLVISTALSLAQKLVPRMGELVTMDMPEGRSLDVSSLAQYVFQALERYQALNNEEET